jgi:hypothetical protein
MPEIDTYSAHRPAVASVLELDRRIARELVPPLRHILLNQRFPKRKPSGNVHEANGREM